MKLRIVTSILTIVVVVAGVSATTHAFFSDAATSSNNTFSTGTLDLTVNGAQSTSANWVGSNMAPGGTPVDATLTFQNVGSINGNHLHVALANSLTGPNEPSDRMDYYLRITTLKYDSTNLTVTDLPDYNGNGYMDLEDWANAAGSDGIPASIKLSPLVDTFVSHTLEVAVQLDAATPTTIMGDTTTSTLTATLHQDASQ